MWFTRRPWPLVLLITRLWQRPCFLTFHRSIYRCASRDGHWNVINRCPSIGYILFCQHHALVCLGQTWKRPGGYQRFCCYFYSSLDASPFLWLCGVCKWTSTTAAAWWSSVVMVSCSLSVDLHCWVKCMFRNPQVSARMRVMKPSRCDCLPSGGSWSKDLLSTPATI